MKNIKLLQLAVAISSLAGLAHGQIAKPPSLSGGVATWSVQTNTAQWNQQLGVQYTRQGCSDSPSECLAFVGKVAASDNVKVTLAIPLNTSTTAAYASQYSQLSLSANYLVEVSIDDFLDQYRALFTPLSQPAALVATVIANLKSANPNLRFGATIYEDELTSSDLQNAKLPAAVRAGFDYIHLFIHYRADGPNFATYVQQAKQLFPNANIIAGSYAYDRRAYLPCAPSGPACTTQQDLDLFEESLTIQAQEVTQGVVDHIEFFPGYFGNEAEWTQWNEPRECSPGDLAECISNTVTIRLAALAILNGTVAAPSWTQLAPGGIQPSARYGHSAAMDSVNHHMIIFGGNSDAAALNDTWVLTNADGKHGQPAWVQLPADNPPPAASYSIGMYDANNNRMMLYGGASGTDVWVLINANGLGDTIPTWVQLVPSGPLPPSLSGWETHVYDPARNVMIVYDSSAGVWVLSNANGLGGAPVWTQWTMLMNGPVSRTGFTAVYNPTSNRMIIFGGADGTKALYDIWVLAHANGLDGTPTWIPLPPANDTRPAARAGHLAIYDPASDAMTIFGGIGQPSDVWTAANASGVTEAPVWTMVNAGGAAPDPRTGGTAVLDTTSTTMITFGGLDPNFVNSVFALWPVM